MKKLLLSAIGVGLIISGCATNQPQKQEPKNVNMCESVYGQGAPDWTCNPEIKGYYSAVGISEPNPMGINFQKTEATAQARDALARELSVKVQNMFKQYQSTTGVGKDQTAEKATTNVSRQLANATLNDSRVYRMWRNKEGKLFVLVIMPKEEVKEKLKQSIKTTFKNDKALWQEFKAKKAQEELEKAIDKEFN